MSIKRKAEKTLFLTFLLSVIIGTLLHFAFDFFGGNTLVGAFAPVNESIWEHLKLILIPSILVAPIEFYSFGKHYKGYLASKSFATVIGMLVVLSGYYTYSGIFGTDYFIADIILFFFGMAVTSLLTYLFITKFNFSERESIIGISMITFLLIVFMYFTFNPPMLELFRDPLSEDFGIHMVQ